MSLTRTELTPRFFYYISTSWAFQVSATSAKVKDPVAWYSVQHSFFISLLQLARSRVCYYFPTSGQYCKLWPAPKVCWRLWSCSSVTKFLQVPRATKYSFFCKRARTNLWTRLFRTVTGCTRFGRDRVNFVHSSSLFGTVFSTGDKTSVGNTPMLHFLLHRACTLLRLPLPLKLPLQPMDRGGQEAGRGHTWEIWAPRSEQGLAGVSAASWGHPTTWVNEDTGWHSIFEIWAQAAAKLRFKITW